MHIYPTGSSFTTDVCLPPFTSDSFLDAFSSNPSVLSAKDSPPNVQLTWKNIGDADLTLGRRDTSFLSVDLDVLINGIAYTDWRGCGLLTGRGLNQTVRSFASTGNTPALSINGLFETDRPGAAEVDLLTDILRSFLGLPTLYEHLFELSPLPLRDDSF